MTGQDAVKSAEEFHARIGITGIVLSKLDGDARAGRALRGRGHGPAGQVRGARREGGRPRALRPRAHGGRILGMGDVLGLIEKAEELVDREQAEALVRKLRRSEFTLEDYRTRCATRQDGSPRPGALHAPGMGS
jgi:signal recognition particle subunit SRP54